MKINLFYFVFSFIVIIRGFFLFQLDSLLMPALHQEKDNPLLAYEQQLLERVRNAGCRELDLAIAMGANDFLLGSGIRNCCSIEHYYSCCLLEDPPEELNIEDLKLMIHDRPYLVIVTDNFQSKEGRCIYLIKNAIESFQNAKTLQIYHDKTCSLEMFTPLTSEDLDEIKTLSLLIDRCIIGYLHPEHLITFRKDQDDEWFKIDSLDSYQQKITPFEFLSRFKQDTVFMFYIAP